MTEAVPSLYEFAKDLVEQKTYLSFTFCDWIKPSCFFGASYDCMCLHVDKVSQIHCLENSVASCICRLGYDDLHHSCEVFNQFCLDSEPMVCLDSISGEGTLQRQIFSQLIVCCFCHHGQGIAQCSHWQWMMTQVLSGDTTFILSSQDTQAFSCKNSLAIVTYAISILLQVLYCTSYSLSSLKSPANSWYTFDSIHKDYLDLERFSTKHTE